MPNVTTRKHLRWEAFYSTSKRFFIIAFIEILVLLLGIFLLQNGVLQLDTVITVVLSEVGIAVILYYLLGGQEHQREEEIVNLANAYEKFQHLKGYSFPAFNIRVDYWFYYVENTITNQCYKAPKYIEHLIDRGAIPEKECKNIQELRDLLIKRKCQLHENAEAKLLDLLITKRTRRRGEQTELL